MKFKTHNDDIAWEGGSLQGEIDASYHDIVDTFGEPHNSDGYKVDAEWDIKFDDETYATIYNYKTGKNYLGDDGCEVEEMRDWHIGGSGGQHGVMLIQEALEGKHQHVDSESNNLSIYSKDELIEMVVQLRDENDKAIKERDKHRQTLEKIRKATNV